jgi:hypothetical protein
MGLQAIDAPMSGGPARARDGTMSLMVACADAVFSQHSALINTLSAKVFRISQQPGDGARTKLVNNLLAGINLVGAAEVLALAARMGLDLARTLDVIEQSSGQSWIGSDRMRRAIAGDYAPRAHVTCCKKTPAWPCRPRRPRALRARWARPRAIPLRAPPRPVWMAWTMRPSTSCSSGSQWVNWLPSTCPRHAHHPDR